MEKIGKLIVGAGESSADMRYATGLSTPDAFIWAAKDDVSVAVLSPLEFDRARRQAKPGVRLMPERELGGVNRVENIVKLAKHLGVRGFVVPFEFPLRLADRSARFT